MEKIIVIFLVIFGYTSCLFITKNGLANTTLYQFPWLVTIEFEHGSKLIRGCGGFLISGRYVVTAANCFGHEELKAKNVVLGDYNTTHEGEDCIKSVEGDDVCNDGALRVPLEGVLVHPKVDVDLALVRLGRLAPYTDFIRPICLPSTEEFDVAREGFNSTFSLAGWATRPQPDNKAQNTPAYVNLWPRFWECKTRKMRKLCEKIEETYGLWSDVGSPIMLKKNRKTVVVAMTNRPPHLFKYTTNIYQYRDWILDRIRNWRNLIQANDTVGSKVSQIRPQDSDTIGKDDEEDSDEEEEEENVSEPSTDAIVSTTSHNNDKTTEMPKYSDLAIQNIKNFLILISS